MKNNYGLPKTELQKIDLAIPPDAILNQFDVVIKPIEAMIRRNEEENRRFNDIENNAINRVPQNRFKSIFSERVIQMENIEQRVKKIVAEQLGVNEAEVKIESSFVDDLGADSLDTVELVMALEEEFGCEIPDEDAEKITSVQQAIDYVNAHPQ